MSVYENDQGRPTLGFMFGLPGEPLLRPPVGAARPESAPDGGALAAPLQPAWPPVDPEGLVRGGVRIVPTRRPSTSRSRPLRRSTSCRSWTCGRARSTRRPCA